MHARFWTSLHLIVSIVRISPKQRRMFTKWMKRILMAVPLLTAFAAQAQDTLRIDLAQALDIALSESPTIKIANQEIEKKRYAHKGSV